MNVLKQKRGNAKACITRAAEFVSSIEPSTTLEMLEIRLSRVLESWNEFSSLHYECLKHVEAEEVEQYYEDFGVYELKYFEAHAGLKKAIRERQLAEALKDKESTSNTSVLERIANQQSEFLKGLDSSTKVPEKVSLPPIVIPKFSGDYKDWPSFRDLFLGSVDTKPNLSPTHKFQYLKSFLCGTAADLIQHIKVSDANYSEAWDRLERRFDRVNLIVQSFINSFLSLPSINISNAKTLRKITDGADEVIRGLNALNKTSRDPWLIYILLNKLDTETKHAWAEEIGSREDSSIQDLIDFLERRCDALETCQSLDRSASSRGKQQVQIRSFVAQDSETKLKCPMCKSAHQLYQCSKFTELDIPSRRLFTKNNSICYSCLRSGHSSNKCRSSFRCRICKARHHHLVHQDDCNVSNSSVSVPANLNLPSTSSTSSAFESPVSNAVAPLINNHSTKLGPRVQTVLPTILAQLKNKWDQLVDVRVLLDTGSQSSFISEACAQRLALPRTHARFPVVGLGSTAAGHTKGCVSLTLLSRYNPFNIQVDAFVLGKLTSNLPSKPFNVSTWNYIQNLELADPNFNLSSAVDIILGADKVWSILKSGQIFGPQGKPLAQNTLFGWVISGELIISDQQSVEISSFCSAIEVDSLLQRFWELEEVPSVLNRSTCNDPAEEHFLKTFSRELHYIVGNPTTSSSSSSSATPSTTETLQVINHYE